MRKALPLLALVLVAAGCGRTYTEAAVQQALGLSERSDVHFFVDASEPASQTVFATRAAITDLVIEETPALPQAVYEGDGVFVERYGTSHDAWLAAHAPNRHALTFILPPGGGRVIIRPYANLVFVGESSRVNAAIARLH
jgi:hypothetical protein